MQLNSTTGVESIIALLRYSYSDSPYSGSGKSWSHKVRKMEGRKVRRGTGGMARVWGSGGRVVVRCVGGDIIDDRKNSWNEGAEGCR